MESLNSIDLMAMLSACQVLRSNMPQMEGYDENDSSIIALDIAILKTQKILGIESNVESS